MSKVKQIRVALLALVAALALMVPMTAFADDPASSSSSSAAASAPVEITSGSITVNAKEAGHEYDAYQVIKGDFAKITEDGEEKIIVSNAKWGTGIKDLDANENNAALVAEIAGITVTRDVEGVATQVKPFDGITNAADFVGKLESVTDSEVLDKLTQIIDKYANTAEGKHIDLTVPNPETPNGEGLIAHTATDVAPGYYFIKDAKKLTGDKAYSYSMLQVVGDAVQTSKSDKPEVTKEVLEDNTGLYGKDAAWESADPISYRITGTLPENYAKFNGYYYKFTDRMSPGLTLDESSIKVYAVKGIEGEADYSKVEIKKDVANAGWTLAPASTTTVGSETWNVMTVYFQDLQKAEPATATDTLAIDASTRIVVEYKATLNKNCVVGDPGNPNDVKLTYANNPNKEGKGTPDDEPDVGETEWDHAIVFTFKLDTTKVDQNDESKLLKDAKFKLYRTKNNAIEYAIIDADTNTITGWTTTKADGSTFTTPENGNFVIKGLDGFKIKYTKDGEGNITKTELIGDVSEKTYYLEEIEAPVGYQLLADPIKVTISAAYEQGTYDGSNATDVIEKLDISTQLGSATAVAGTGNKDEGSVAHKIGNTQGGGLPSTGGIGTTIFYVVGGGLIIAALITMVVRRRKSAAAA